MTLTTKIPERFLCRSGIFCNLRHILSLEGEGVAMIKEKKNITGKININKIMWGTLVCLMLSAISMLISSLSVYNEYISISSLKLVAFFAHAISVFIGVQVVGNLFKRLSLAEIIIISASYGAIYTAIAIMLFEGMTIQCIYNFGVAMVSAILSYFLCHSLQNKSNIAKKRKRNW